MGQGQAFDPTKSYTPFNPSGSYEIASAVPPETEEDGWVMDFIRRVIKGADTAVEGAMRAGNPITAGMDMFRTSTGKYPWQSGYMTEMEEDARKSMGRFQQAPVQRSLDLVGVPASEFMEGNYGAAVGKGAVNAAILIAGARQVPKRGAAGAATSTTRPPLTERLADSLDRSSVSRMESVVLPNTSETRTALTQRVREAAPVLAREEGMGAISRSGLSQKLDNAYTSIGDTIKSTVEAMGKEGVVPLEPLKQQVRNMLRGWKPQGQSRISPPVRQEAVSKQIKIMEGALEELDNMGANASVNDLLTAMDNWGTQSRPNNKGQVGRHAEVYESLRQAVRNHLGDYNATLGEQLERQRMVEGLRDSAHVADMIDPAWRGKGALGGVIGGRRGAIIGTVVDTIAGGQFTANVAFSRALARAADFLRQGKTARAEAAFNDAARAAQRGAGPASGAAGGRTPTPPVPPPPAPPAPTVVAEPVPAGPALPPVTPPPVPAPRPFEGQAMPTRQSPPSFMAVPPPTQVVPPQGPTGVGVTGPGMPSPVVLLDQLSTGAITPEQATAMWQQARAEAAPPPQPAPLVPTGPTATQVIPQHTVPVPPPAPQPSPWTLPVPREAPPPTGLPAVTIPSNVPVMALRSVVERRGLDAAARVYNITPDQVKALLGMDEGQIAALHSPRGEMPQRPNVPTVESIAGPPVADLATPSATAIPVTVDMVRWRDRWSKFDAKPGDTSRLIKRAVDRGIDPTDYANPEALKKAIEGAAYVEPDQPVPTRTVAPKKAAAPEEKPKPIPDMMKLETEGTGTPGRAPVRGKDPNEHLIVNQAVRSRVDNALNAALGVLDSHLATGRALQAEAGPILDAIDGLRQNIDTKLGSGKITRGEMAAFEESLRNLTNVPERPAAPVTAPQPQLKEFKAGPGPRFVIVDNKKGTRTSFTPRFSTAAERSAYAYNSAKISVESKAAYLKNIMDETGLPETGAKDYAKAVLRETRKAARGADSPGRIDVTTDPVVLERLKEQYRVMPLGQDLVDFFMNNPEMNPANLTDWQISNGISRARGETIHTVGRIPTSHKSLIGQIRDLAAVREARGTVTRGRMGTDMSLPLNPDEFLPIEPVRSGVPTDQIAATVGPERPARTIPVPEGPTTPATRPTPPPPLVIPGPEGIVSTPPSVGSFNAPRMIIEAPPAPPVTPPVAPPEVPVVQSTPEPALPPPVAPVQGGNSVIRAIGGNKELNIAAMGDLEIAKLVSKQLGEPVPNKLSTVSPEVANLVMRIRSFRKAMDTLQKIAKGQLPGEKEAGPAPSQPKSGRPYFLKKE